MSKTFDFNSVKKHYLTVKLADEKNTTLLVGTPPKAIMDKITQLQADFNDMTDEDKTNGEIMDDLYDVCARIMSCNKAGVKISAEYLGNLLDFEDIFLFFNAYVGFIEEISTAKN